MLAVVVKPNEGVDYCEDSPDNERKGEELIEGVQE